jgi:hypothetical protein
MLTSIFLLHLTFGFVIASPLQARQDPVLEDASVTAIAPTSDQVTHLLEVSIAISSLQNMIKFAEEQFGE